MGVQFLIDSASDILQDEAKKMGITCIPMEITFGQAVYQDGVTLSHAEFYTKLAQSSALPATSQINPTVYTEYFEKLTANGDQLVVITLSSELSGTYQSALIAAGDYADKVFVVDSLNAAIGERILLLRGLQLRAQGLTAKEIAGILDQEKSQIRLAAMIDTLEYLKKGGRISAAVAFAGGALGIKPAIEIRDGKVVMAGKARGIKQCHSLLKQLIDNAGEIDRDKPVAAVFSASDEGLQQFFADYPELSASAHGLGCTIGTHIGPGAYGLAFFAK